MRTGLRFVLSIDNGSQSTKVSVIDQYGVVHASGRQPLRPSVSPVPGQVVHPDDDLWDSVQQACRVAVAAFQGRPETIEAVGLCTIRYCRAMLDDHGRLLQPVLSWMDERVSRPYDPAGGEPAAYVTTSSGYIGHRLTGEFRDAAANYQGVWPIDQSTTQWSGDRMQFERTGMRRDQLMDLAAPGDQLGAVTAVAAVATGIPCGTPVYATANDKAVEALGAGLRSGADGVLLSLGTYIAAMTVTAQPQWDTGKYWVNFAATPGDYLVESGGIRRGMWTVSWIRDLLEPVAPSGGLDDDGVSVEQTLEAQARLVPPGCNGLLAVMDWLAPTRQPHRRGAFIGFDGTQGSGALYRCVLEGIALTMAEHVEAMEAALGRGSEPLIVSGGGAKSGLMMQIFADVLNRPTVRTGMDDAAGLGAAICAAVGAGIHPGWDEAVAAMVTTGVRFEPDPGGVGQYTEVRTRYRRLLRAGETLMREVYEAGAQLG